MQLLSIQPTLVKGNLLQAGNLVALTLFDGFHKLRRLQQTLVSARVKPGKATSKQFHVQITLLQIGAVNIGDFQFAPIAGFNLPGNIDNAVIVEVQPGHCVIGFGLDRLFFNGDGALVAIEFHHTKTLRVFHLVAEYGGTLTTLNRLTQLRRKALTIEDIISEHQTHIAVADEFLTNDKGLSETIRTRLNGIT